MKTKPPPQRRKFADAADKTGYLYEQLLYWLYQRGDAARARPYANRLHRQVRKVDPQAESISGQEYRSLIQETKGNLARAIAHREQEIQRMRRLHEISRGSPQEALIFKLYSYEALSDRLDLLAILYHDSGQLDRAIDTLQESKRLCKEHGLKFDAPDVLRDYLAEAAGAAKANGRPQPKKRDRARRTG